MRRAVVSVLLVLVSSVVVVAAPAPEAAAAPSAGFSADWDGDGQPDVVADDLQGRLWLYPGNGYGGFRQRVQIGSGWQNVDEVRPVGDWDLDGDDDLVARDRLGQLFLYEGDGAGGFGGIGPMGRGWHVFRDIVGLGDWTGDGIPDVAGLRRDDGRLVLYPGDGDDGFGVARTIGTNWQAMDGLTSAGDWDEDGDADLLVRNAATGGLVLYRGDGAGGFDGTVAIGRGWNAFTALIGLGDFDGNGRNDVLARNRAGDLLLYPGASGDGFAGAPRVIGRGWSALDLNQAGVINTPAGTAAAALAALPVTAGNPTGFAATLFRHWIDADGDCRNTRSEVLVRESVEPVEFHDVYTRCRPYFGDWRPFLDGGYSWPSDEYLVVGHVVPLAEAWTSGARTWTAARRQAYANDLGYGPSLTVMRPATNTARAGRDIAQWQSEHPSARCAYAARWVAVKYRWRLSVDIAERSALADVLTGSCGFSTLTLPPRA